MQVNYVLFVLYCTVPLLLHMADSHKYCRFTGLTQQYAYCSPSDTNRTFDYVPSISHRIEYINLNEQPLKQLPRNSFRNISSQNELVTIYLCKCKIHHIDVDAFMNLDNLKFLNMSENSISRFETGTFQHTRKLMRFRLGFNKIDKLQTGLFHNLIYLQEASFKNNSITCVDKDTFRNTPSLKRVNLQFNKLEYLSPLFTDNFVNVSSLVLGDNPLNCDCNLRELYEKNKVRKSRYGDPELICQNPSGIRGRKFPTLTSNSFACVARIIVPKNDTRVVTLGSNVTLSCAVFAVPVPGIKWHRGSNIIALYNVFGSLNMNVNMHYLNYTFTVQEEDLGVYYCSAYNRDEIVKSSTTLTMDVTTK